MANEEIIPKQLEKSVFGYANGSSGKKGGEGVKYRLLFSVLLLHFFCLSQLLLGDNIEMTNKNTNKMSVQSWNENAFVWDQLMDEGSFFQEQVVDPALEKMISDIKKGTKVLEIACGNGFLSRRLARRGADVWAFDSSANAIFLAKKIAFADESNAQTSAPLLASLLDKKPLPQAISRTLVPFFISLIIFSRAGSTT